MESKYYTPDTSEFFIGFEFKLSVTRYTSATTSDIVEKDCIWGIESSGYNLIVGEAIVNKRDSLSIVEELIKDNKIKIKYLDKEDIESLGFNLNNEDDNYFIFTQNIMYLGNVILKLHKRDYGRLILKNSTDLFLSVNVKNKSELKKLLQQLNIK